MSLYLFYVDPLTYSAGNVVIRAWLRAGEEPHWHFTTEGLGGFELSARIPADSALEPPEWALGAFRQLIGYTQIMPVVAGDVLNLGFAFAAFSAHLRGIWFVDDPDPVDRDIRYLQVVGVTADELRAISGGHSAMVSEYLQAVTPLLLTDRERESVVHFPQ